MISSLQIQKKVFEQKQDPPKTEVLVINIQNTGFELGLLSADMEIVKLAELAFKEPVSIASDLTDHFLQFADEFSLTRSTFKTIYVNWLNSNFTLIPAAYYETGKAKELLDFNVGVKENETVLVNDLKDNIKLIFSIPTELKQAIDKTFPHHQLKHFGSSSVNLFFSHFQLKNSDVFLNIHEKQVELLVKKEKALQLYNIFNCKSDEDILYYLMFSVEQFKLDPASLRLCISGNRETSDELFTAIKKYIRHLNFANSDKIIKRKEELENIPNHFYFSLLNRVLCE
jgi:hypothetical protein